MEQLIETLSGLANDWKEIPLLARTHGQPASPTMLGKEIMVFVERLTKQVDDMRHIPFASKFGGATGNFNAHTVAFPEHNWPEFANEFVNNGLGLSRSQITTQIEHYDYLAALFDNMKRINTIIMDLDRDMWTYISMDYFQAKNKSRRSWLFCYASQGKPYRFRKLGRKPRFGQCTIHAFSRKITGVAPTKRFKRILPSLRNVGVPIAHSVIALQATLKGLGKLLLNADKIALDLENNWAVVAEAIQTILRREKYPNPYEALKALTRTNEAVNANTMAKLWIPWTFLML